MKMMGKSCILVLMSNFVLLLTIDTLTLPPYIHGGQSSIDSVTTPPLWILRNRESVSRCALIEMTALFQITYQTTPSKMVTATSVGGGDSIKNNVGIDDGTKNDEEDETVVTRTINLTLSSDASLSVATDSRQCLPDGNGYLHLDLSFGRLHNLVLLFRLEEDHYTLSALALEYTINRKEFPGHRYSRGVTAVSLKSNLDTFRTPLGKSYSCKSEQQIILEGSDQVTMVVKDLKFEVFNPRSDMKFSPATECDFDVHSFSTREIVVAALFFAFMSSLVVICLIRRIRKKQRAVADVLPLPEKPGFEPDLSKA